MLTDDQKLTVLEMVENNNTMSAVSFAKSKTSARSMMSAMRVISSVVNENKELLSNVPNSIRDFNKGKYS